MTLTSFALAFARARETAAANEGFVLIHENTERSDTLQ